MAERKVRMAQCCRCAHTWRMRRRYPRICPRCKSSLWRTPVVRAVRRGSGLGIDEILGPYRSEIRRMGRERGALGFRVFGSVGRREASASSDVDLLVTLHPSASWLDFSDLHAELERLLGRRVDLIEDGQLPESMASRVAAEAVPL